MLLRYCASSKFTVVVAAAIFMIIVSVSLIYHQAHPSQDHVLVKPSQSLPNPSSPSEPQTPIPDLPLPREYTPIPHGETTFCADRFGTKYLAHLREHSHEYCDKRSASSLRCFHSQTASSRTDTFCIGRSATFNLSNNKFNLDCEISNPGVQEIPDFNNFGSYWYDTGPRVVFDGYVEVKKSATELSDASRPPTSKEFTVLLKREGEGNIWHCLMEIISLTISVDVLQMSRDFDTSQPLFTLDDIQRTQVVVLDGHTDGPYFDLWRLFAKKPILRLSDLDGQTPMSNIIVPLAGGANPFWQGDWDVLPCEQSAVLRTFIRRVISFLDIKTIPESQGDIVVTFINRVEGRRLVDQDKLIHAAKAKLDHVKIQIVDLAVMSFREQVQLVSSSDVLVGVHGAGLTHGMWLRPGSVMAEILPQNLHHKGFRNLAGMLGHKYFSAHAGTQIERRDWHVEDVYIEEGRFADLVEIAVKSVYNKGSRSFDVVR